MMHGMGDDTHAHLYTDYIDAEACCGLKCALWQMLKKI